MNCSKEPIRGNKSSYFQLDKTQAEWLLVCLHVNHYVNMNRVWELRGIWLKVMVCALEVVCDLLTRTVSFIYIYNQI